MGSTAYAANLVANFFALCSIMFSQKASKCSPSGGRAAPCAGPHASDPFAYEPIWAIGEQVTPTDPAYADARHADQNGCRRVSGVEPPCLYHVSIKAGNSADLDI
jgi:triosephosphate isomerase